MKRPAGRDPRNQIAAGCFFAIWCALGWWSAATNPALWLNDYGADPGPGLLPTLVLGLVTVGALTLIVSGAYRASVQPPPPGYLGSLTHRTLIPSSFLISLFVYITAIDFIGFVFASILFSSAWMAFLGSRVDGERATVTLFRSAAGTLIGVALVYFVFVYLIRVPL